MALPALSTDGWAPGVARYVGTGDHEDLADFCTVDLPGLSYEGATDFYADLLALHARTRDDNALAILGLSDRYFLLTALLARPDALDPWLFNRCREVEAEPDECLDLWAREHYKSTIITYAGAIQEVLRDPEITIGIFSDVGKVAKPFLVQIKTEFETNGRLKRIFHDVLWSDPAKQAPRWSVDGGIIVKRAGNPKEATVEAHGLIDGMPTGRHFGLRIYDDVVTKEGVTTPDMVKKVTATWELSDNLGTRGGRRWHVGTRYSFGDTYGVILERGILKERIYPATDSGRLDGKPVLLSAEQWEAKKKTQASTVAAQMLQNPAAGEDATFSGSMFKAYEVRPHTMHVYILGDPSKGPSANMRSDNTSLAVVGVDSAFNFFLLDGYRHKMNLGQRWVNLKGLYRKWTRSPGVLTVEVWYEEYGLQADIEHFEQMMALENYSFAVGKLAWPRQGGHSKQDRVERLVPDMLKGRFFLPAVTHHEVHGQSTWTWDNDRHRIVYSPLEGPTKAQRAAEANGQKYRCIGPIKRLDHEKGVYDLTRCFIEEALYFPFAARDDLIDSVSRIYDAEPAAPKIEDLSDIEPSVHVDT